MILYCMCSCAWHSRITWLNMKQETLHWLVNKVRLDICGSDSWRSNEFYDRPPNTFLSSKQMHYYNSCFWNINVIDVINVMLRFILCSVTHCAQTTIKFIHSVKWSNTYFSVIFIISDDVIFWQSEWFPKYFLNIM